MGALIVAGVWKPQCDRCSRWSEEYRKAKGCLGPTKHPIISWNEYQWFECPNKILPRWVFEFFKLYSMLKITDSWPASGSILDQPYKFMQAILLVERICGEAREQEMNLTEKKHAK